MSGSAAGFRTFRKSSGWARRQPRTADLLRVQGAAAASAAIRCRKAVAARLGKSVDSIDRIVNGDASSPVSRFAELMLAVEEPEHLEAYTRILSMRRKIEALSLAECRAELDEIIRQREPDAEHAENRAALEYLATGKGASELRNAAAREAAVQIRMCALIDRIEELEARRP